MSKELFVTSTPHETKLAIVDDDQVVEVYFERENEYTLAGSIYKGKVTRVLPGMQSAFVDVGLERDAFLYVTDFLEEVEEDQDEAEVTPQQPPPQQRRGRPDNRRGRDTRVAPQKAEPQEGAVTIEADFTDHEEEVDAAEQTETVASSQLTSEARAAEEEIQPDQGGAKRWRGRRGRRRGRTFQGEDTQIVDTPQQPDEAATATTSQEQVRFEGAEPNQDQGQRRAELAAGEFEAAHSEEPPIQQVPQRPRQAGIALPGESLRKYGGGQAPEPRTEHRQTPRSTGPRPSTEIADPSKFTFTGGAFAAESLAKYRNRPQESRVERETAAESQALTQTRVASQPAESADTYARPSFEATTSHPTAQLDPTPSLAASSAEIAAFEDSRKMPAVQDDMLPEQPRGEYNFRPGTGVLEEEEISEEEHDTSHFGEQLDDTDLEEMEEETLEADEDSSRKEDELIAASEGLAAAFAESRRQSEIAQDETEDEDEEDGQAIPVGDAESAEVRADEEAQEQEFTDPEDPNYEGRAETRAPAVTAGFQQKAAERDRDQGRRGPRGRRMPRRMRGRRNMQPHNVPQINELLKEGQEILVQIAKEPMAKKGARITSHIALPGRFLVYMPTVHHTGVSRKIGSEEERQRLKRIMLSEKGQAQGGFIVRTAAAGASEDELRSDIRFLINLWTEIKQRSESGKAPALIYHDLNLVERILRDQVTGNFSTIWVDTEQEYERILRFAQRFQPSLIKRVKLYSKETPLFEQFGVQEEINKALKSKVWLKSGGYIVINQTEALVAIDINTGKYVGKTGRLEDTIVKTNVDAIQEIVRQIRLRDLGGIIIIDFIDMDERRNRQKVMQALEEALRKDRSPSKVLQFNDFGLVAITRKRVKQSLERTLSTQCTYCTGTGMIKSVATVCNEIYVEMRKMSKHFDSQQVMLRVNPEVAKALKENSGRWLTEMEELIRRTIIVKSDPAQHQEQFEIH